MIRTLLAAAGAVILAPVGMAQSLFAVGGFANFAGQSLYTINPSTGAATLVGSTGLSQIADIAWDRTTGRLLALTVQADVYRLDLSTGAATLLSARAGIVPEGALAVNSTGVVFTSVQDRLHTLDVTSAAVTPSGPLGVSDNDLSGLAFSAAGGLFAYATNGGLPDALLSIDPVTGAGTRVGLTGFTNTGGLGGLTFLDDGAGALLLSDGSSLYSVDPTTGGATLIGSHGIGGVSGIAFVPTPGTAVVLGAVGLLAWRRRRGG